MADRGIDGLQKGAFFAKNKPFRLRPIEVPLAFFVVLQPATIDFILCQRRETDHSPGYIVGPFVGEKVSDELASAAGNDSSPVLGVNLERGPLKGVDLITDEAGDAHCGETSATDVGLEFKHLRRVNGSSTVEP